MNECQRCGKYVNPSNFPGLRIGPIFSDYGGYSLCPKCYDFAKNALNEKRKEKELLIKSNESVWDDDETVETDYDDDEPILQSKHNKTYSTDDYLQESIEDRKQIHDHEKAQCPERAWAAFVILELAWIFVVYDFSINKQDTEHTFTGFFVAAIAAFLATIITMLPLRIISDIGVAFGDGRTINTRMFILSLPFIPWGLYCAYKIFA